MKYLKTYERMIYLNSTDKKSPDGYKFNVGDYVTCTDITSYWRENGFDEETVCIVAIVNIPQPNQYPNVPYVIVPVNAKDSSFEKWVKEEDIKFAPEEKIAANKYNL